MGIFDRFKKIKKDPEIKEVEVEKKMVYSMIASDGDRIEVHMPQNIGKVRHRDGRETQVFITQIMKMQRDTFRYDIADFISFELLKGQEINDEIMTAVMKQYEMDIRGKTQEEQQTYYLGQLSYKEEGEYEFSNKSSKVEEKVRSIVTREIDLRNQEELAAYNKRRQEEQEELFKESLNAVDYLKHKQEEKNQRKLNPTLTRDDDLMWRGKYADYKGVNVNTGEILRVRKVDKVGKDGSGTYLYSAYIENADNKDDTYYYDGENPSGYAVCFELPKRLEDMVQSKRTEEIIPILELLSDERNFQDMHQLTYIGEIDKNGQVNRREKSESKAIQMRIESMQQEFAQNAKSQSESRQ